MSDQLIIEANARADDLISRADVYLEEIKSNTLDDVVAIGNDGVSIDSDGNVKNFISLRNLKLFSKTESLLDVGNTKLTDLTPVVNLNDLDKTSLIDISAPAKIASDQNYYTASIPDIWDEESIPTFTGTAPTINSTAAPESNTLNKPTPYGAQDVDKGPWATTDLPTELDLLYTSLEPMSNISLPDIDLNIPSMDLVVPPSEFEYVEATYSSDLLASVQALLMTDITEGSYGINPDDEQKLYARGREREAKTAAKAIEQVRKGIAARGFAVPPGSLYAAERVIANENTVALGQLNREIVLKRSDLYVQARQFAVQQGLNLEQVLITYTGAKQARALDAAKASINFALEVHNLNVGLFNLNIELKRLQFESYRELLAKATVEIQVYEKAIAHADMNNKTNQVKLQGYSQGLEAYRAFYDAQLARVKYSNLSIDIEKLQLDSARLDADTYAINVKAAVNETEVYKAIWQAAEIEQQAYATSVKANNLEVEGAVKRIEAKKARLSDELALLNVKRDKQRMFLDHEMARLKLAEVEMEADKQANVEILTEWEVLRQLDKANTAEKNESIRKHVDSYLNAESININKLSTTINAVQQSKELKNESATTVLDMYRDAIKSAASSASSIITSST